MCKHLTLGEGRVLRKLLIGELRFGGEERWQGGRTRGRQKGHVVDIVALCALDVVTSVAHVAHFAAAALTLDDVVHGVAVVELVAAKAEVPVRCARDHFATRAESASHLPKL